MTALMRELHAEGWHLLLSTTMWMRAEELALFPHTLKISAAELKYMLDSGDVRDIFYAINTNGATFYTAKSWVGRYTAHRRR
ncbi:MAG: hypothetical protein HC828_21515, partial [Blastochloris sp.]|nr:hypothetical protein [Blastochloris sp.]